MSSILGDESNLIIITEWVVKTIIMIFVLLCHIICWDVITPLIPYIQYMSFIIALVKVFSLTVISTAILTFDLIPRTIIKPAELKHNNNNLVI